MKRRVFTMFAAGLIAAAPVIPAFAGMAEDKAAIRQIWVDYQTARVAGDVDKWLGLWDEGGIQMPPGRAPRDKATLMATQPERWKAAPAKTMTITPEEIEVAGDWAYSRGSYSSDRVNAKGEEIHIEGKFMTIHKRQDDGAWKIYRDIFNANPQ